MNAGQTYTVDVKGSSSNSGTLVRPYVYVYQTINNILKEGGGGGTGMDAKLTFTAATAGIYNIQVTAYIYDNNAGTFTLTVN